MGRSPMITFDIVRKFGLQLPDVEEATGSGTPSLTVHGKLLTCPAIHKSAEPGSIMVRLSFDQRAELLAADPATYYITDHYLEYPSVLVRLARIHPDALQDLLGMAWRFVTAKNAPKKAPKKRNL